MLLSGRWTPYVINKPSCYFVPECPVDHQCPPLKEDNSGRKSVIFPYNIESLHWDDSIGWMHRCRDNSTRKKNEMVTIFSISKIYASERERGISSLIRGCLQHEVGLKVLNMDHYEDEWTMHTKLVPPPKKKQQHSNQIHSLSVLHVTETQPKYLTCKKIHVSLTLK